jgi:amino acid adenylation domain-containing protein
MMTESEELELISAWNDTCIDYPGGLYVHNLFDAQAECIPDAIALDFRGRQLTYAQLGRRANQLANYLKSMGVGPEVRVGLSMDCGQELVVAVLGVLKAGGVYVPLDPTCQLQQLIDILEDAQPSVLLTQERLRGDLPGQWAQIIYLDTNWEAIARCSGDRPSVELTPHSLAYLAYISGLTGRPIGVQVQHGGLANLLQATRSRPELRQSDTLLAITQAPLDIVRLELFLPLVVGARIAEVSNEEASNGMRLWERMREEGVTALSSPASTWRQLVEAGWRADGRMKALCHGNALSFQLATEMRSRGAEVWNLYWHAETPVWASMQLVEENVCLSEPVANTNIVFEEEGRLAASGVAGELYIGGEWAASGYFRRPHLTAGRFVPDDYSGRVGARLYRTGEMVRRRANGVLEYVGKADQQAILYSYGYKGAAGLAPSDFPLAKLSQSELDRLLQTLELINIEDSK